MTPQMGVTKQQVQMQLDEFKRQVVIKQRLLEIQEQRAATCIEAEHAYEQRDRSVDRWDDASRANWYRLENVQSQLMADNLREELGQLNNAVMEMTEIIHRMASGIVLPRLEKTSRSNPGGN